MEMFIENGRLISKEGWEKKIDSLREEVESFPKIDQEEIKKELKNNIVEAVRKRIPKEHFGVFLSGGVDSSTIAMICANEGGDFTCYNVGFRDGDMQEAPDFVEAKRVAEKLNLILVAKKYNIEEAKEIVKDVVKILPKQEINSDFVVKVGVASVVVAVSKIADDKIFFSGLGSEEIFAGYQRHEKADDINEECWN